MKYAILLFVALSVFIGYRAAINARDDKATQGSVSVVDKARTADGRIDLAKILDSPILPEERRAALKEADVDGDGFLTEEEYEDTPALASAWREEAERKAHTELEDEQVRKMLFLAYSETQGQYYNSEQAFNFAFRIASMM